MKGEMLEHLSETQLWSKIKSGQRLDDTEIEHTRACLDCRQLVQERTDEAKAKGLPFPDRI
jgi:hypothetical protein